MSKVDGFRLTLSLRRLAISPALQNTLSHGVDVAEVPNLEPDQANEDTDFHSAATIVMGWYRWY